MAPCCPSSVTSQPLHLGRVWHCWPCSAAPSTCLWFCTFFVSSLAFSFIPAPQCLHSPGFWTVSICLPAPFDPLSSTGSCFLPLNTVFAASSALLLSSHTSPAVLEHATTLHKHLPDSLDTVQFGILWITALTPRTVLSWGFYPPLLCHWISFQAANWDS